MEVFLMEIDVGEYINKDIKNQSSRPLLPIYEAISNSLHAEAKKIEIIIEILKRNVQTNLNKNII